MENEWFSEEQNIAAVMQMEAGRPAAGILTWNLIGFLNGISGGASLPETGPAADSMLESLGATYPGAFENVADFLEGVAPGQPPMPITNWGSLGAAGVGARKVAGCPGWSWPCQ